MCPRDPISPEKENKMGRHFPRILDLVISQNTSTTENEINLRDRRWKRDKIARGSPAFPPKTWVGKLHQQILTTLQPVKELSNKLIMVQFSNLKFIFTNNLIETIRYHVVVLCVWRSVVYSLCSNMEWYMFRSSKRNLSYKASALGNAYKRNRSAGISVVCPLTSHVQLIRGVAPVEES